MLDVGVDVTINRAVVEADVALVVGPVFPHEVVGFSGGNKYFFPGVAGQEIIDLSHWLGALITSAQIIGTRGITPVRALIDQAAAMIPAVGWRCARSSRPAPATLHAAASARPRTPGPRRPTSPPRPTSAISTPRAPRGRVIPRKYEDMWTAAKGFYKLEPVVADGGEVIIYAPHITEISPMHPEIEQIGYHCRDYFARQWERFAHLHWGVLAHSTHLRGAGTWDPENGEHDRVTVTLATGIPEAVVRAVNLEPPRPRPPRPRRGGCRPRHLRRTGRR